MSSREWSSTLNAATSIGSAAIAAIRSFIASSKGTQVRLAHIKRTLPRWNRRKREPRRRGFWCVPTHPAPLPAARLKLQIPGQRSVISATALPSSGDNPHDGPVAGKTCDARGLVEIHRMFRNEVGNAPALVDRVADSDSAQAEIVGDQLAMLSTSLHSHHEGEETLLWHQLEDRAPACGGHVDRMKQQHATLLVHLHELDAALPAWRATGSQADAVIAALAGINAALAVHLPDEEVITAAKVNADGQDVRPVGGDPQGATRRWSILAACAPSPLARLIWRLVGRSRYERYRAMLVK